MNTHHWPPAFAERMQTRLGAEYEAFVAACQRPAPVSLRLHPVKGPLTLGELAPYAPQPVEWCSHGLWLNSRPAFVFEPAWHAGAWYVQEASSMALARMLEHLPNRPLLALDLCAAPGGKTTLLASHLPAGSVLVANELIPKRNAILRENLMRWGSPNVVVTEAEAAAFLPLGPVFDFILVDAPCTGEGLWRRDPTAIAHWSEAQVEACALRQKDLLQTARKLLKPGGWLVYSTCTFGEEENEAHFMGTENADYEPITLNLVQYGAEKRGVCYAFLPHRLQGEGFFLAAFRKPGELEPTSLVRGDTSGQTQDIELPPKYWHPWVIPEAQTGIVRRYGDSLRLLPKGVDAAVHRLRTAVRPRAAGILLGEWKGEELLPHSHLALSGWAAAEAVRIAVDKPTALQALKGETRLGLPEGKGWALLSYQGLDLMWVKRIGNRVNHTLPQGLRIRQDLPVDMD